MKNKIIVYVDGFNLYHSLRNNYPHLKQPDVLRLVENMLGEKYDIVSVKFYTAQVTGQLARATQKRYLDKLNEQEKVEVHDEGRFAPTIKEGILLTGDEHYKSLLQKFPKFIREFKLLRGLKLPHTLKFRIRVEKKTDVTLASHLVRDAFLGAFDIAAIITNDADFTEAIRVVRSVVKNGKKLPVWLLSPTLGKNGECDPTYDLKQVVSRIIHITESDFKKAQVSRKK
ncbi:MAG: NYN domain-containing protein [Proteobacteria bacterium]|nr:NYN domain-containing protein [Pseudomonadota bacterium]